MPSDIRRRGQDSLIGDRKGRTALGHIERGGQVIAADDRSWTHHATQPNRLPGGICFSAAIDGVEKNTSVGARGLSVQVTAVRTLAGVFVGAA
jgi:hypothetical protein